MEEDGGEVIKFLDITLTRPISSGAFIHYSIILWRMMENGLLPHPVYMAYNILGMEQDRLDSVPIQLFY